MLVDGTWTRRSTRVRWATTSRPSSAVLQPPIKGVVGVPGDGFSVMKWSKHKKQALSPGLHDDHPGGNLINKAGLSPTSRA